MALNEEVEVLRRVPLFCSVETAKLKLLAFTSERTCFSPGQSLIKQGDMGDCGYLILEGDADVMLDTESGPVKVSGVGRNDFVGEMALLMDQPRTATILARTEVATLKITKESFFQLVEDSPKIGIEMMRILAHRLEATTADLSRARQRLQDAGLQ